MLLTSEEMKILRENPIKYINIIQMLDNERLGKSIHRAGDEYVIECNGFLVPTFENPERFLDIIDELLPEEIFGSSMNFSGLPKMQFEIIEKKFDISWREDCYLLYYNGDKYKDLKEVYEIGGERYVLDKLTSQDIPMVFEHYMFKDEGIGYIEDIVINELSRCFRLDGVPVSWVVQREDGSIGIMYTLASHRRNGLGQVLSKHLINDVIAKGQTPYVHIHTHNEPSLALAKSLGFQIHSEVVWFGGGRRR